MDDLRRPNTLNPEKLRRQIQSELQKMAAMPLSTEKLTVPERIGLVRAYAKILRTNLTEVGSGFKERMLADFEKMMAMPCPGLETATPAQKTRLAKAEMRLAEIKVGKTGRIQ